MVTAYFEQTGDSLDHTPSAAVAAGDVVFFGKRLPTVAKKGIAADETGATDRVGVYRIAKDSSTFTKGDRCYYDAQNERLSIDPSVGEYAGLAAADAATGDTEMYFLLDGNASNLIYSSVAASAAVTTTTTPTKFDKQVTLAANTLRAGDVLRVRAQAIATATNSTDTLNLKLYLGTVEICATGAIDVANNDIGYIEAVIVIRTIGASGTLVGSGTVALGVPGTVTAKPFLKASGAIDTTAANAVAVEATWSSNNAGNSCRLDVMVVEHLRK